MTVKYNTLSSNTLSSYTLSRKYHKMLKMQLESNEYEKWQISPNAYYSNTQNQQGDNFVNFQVLIYISAVVGGMYCIYLCYLIYSLFIFIYLFAQLAGFKLGNAFLSSGYIFRALFLFLQQTMYKTTFNLTCYWFCNIG